MAVGQALLPRSRESCHVRGTVHCQPQARMARWGGRRSRPPARRRHCLHRRASPRSGRAHLHPTQATTGGIDDHTVAALPSQAATATRGAPSTEVPPAARPDHQISCVTFRAIGRMVAPAAVVIVGAAFVAAGAPAWAASRLLGGAGNGHGAPGLSRASPGVLPAAGSAGGVSLTGFYTAAMVLFAPL